MKKVFYTIIMAAICAMSANAQNVIRNNYDSTASNNNSTVNSQPQQSNDIKETIGAIAINYYGFDGFNNWGLGAYSFNPDGLGCEFALRANFESHGNFNFDLGLNYSFQLWQKENNQILLTLAAGPSLRVQDEIKGFDKRGNIEYNTGTLFFDGYLSPRLSFVVNKLTLSAGYFYWMPKWKFSKDDGGSGGFFGSIGYNF